jgi:hypothetical protein
VKPEALRQTIPAVVAGSAVLISLRGVLPLSSAAALFGILAWFAVPGVVLAERLYGRWSVAWLAGPAWGYALSSVVLLGLWAAGVRELAWLMLAPVPAAIAVWPARRLAGHLTAPAFTRRDLAAASLVILAVPAIVGRPYSQVGVDLPEGRAYRAYFTADVVSNMAIVSELSKGEMPPKNPFYVNDALHYYWLAHLLPAAEYRTAFRDISIERLLLVTSLWIGLAFAGFFYFFVRHFVESPWAAALACVFVLFCSSFEGAHQIRWHWERGRDLEGLKYMNLDAITRSYYQGRGMPVDGLHRMLLYQPQHQLGYVLGLSSLVLLIQARDCSRAGLSFLIGTLLGLAILFSSFAAVMTAPMTAIYQSWRLAGARQWKAFIPCALIAAGPMAAAVLVSSLLRYVDTGGSLVRLAVNPIATHAVWIVLFLSFGPVAIVAVPGLLAASWNGAIARFLPIAIVLAVSAFFYFLVDIPDHMGVYVGWRAGHLAFIALTPLCAFGFQEWWRRRGVPRLAIGLGAAAVALAAAPTVAFDLYNTQDVWNRGRGASFRWTVVLSPEEVQGLEWIKQYTPEDARVQVEPYARGRDTWAYIPAFGERRMSVGLPIGMIPLAKYEKASGEIKELYRSTSAQEVYDAAVSHCIDYLVIGPPERAEYPTLQALLDAHPLRFRPAFRNDAITVYAVARESDRPACTV